jgi:hypothetical protein
LGAALIRDPDAALMKWPQSIYWKGVALVVSLGLICYVFGCLKRIPYWNTAYGDGFRKREFYRITRNQTVDEVYQIIGPPLFADVNPDASGTGAYRQKRDYTVALEHVKDLVQKTNTEVYLEYSAPRNARRWYVLYYVDFANGRVKRFGGPIVMD